METIKTTGSTLIGEDTNVRSPFLRASEYIYVNLSLVGLIDSEPGEDEEDVKLVGQNEQTVLRLYGDKAVALRKWLEQNLLDVWSDSIKVSSQPLQVGLVRVGNYKYVNLDRVARIVTEPGEEGEEEVTCYDASKATIARYYEAEAKQLRSWLEAHSSHV